MQQQLSSPAQFLSSVANQVSIQGQVTVHILPGKTCCGLRLLVLPLTEQEQLQGQNWQEIFKPVQNQQIPVGKPEYTLGDTVRGWYSS